MAPSPYIMGRIQRVALAGSRGVTLELDLHLDARPGQFVMVWLPRVDEKPFSLVDDDPLTLTIVQAGPFTERMQHLQVGDALYLRGPFGNGFSLASGPEWAEPTHGPHANLSGYAAHGSLGERPLLVAGGCGAAPLAFLAKRLREAGREVTVALGARSAGELLLAERFAGLGARVILCTEDGSVGERGLVTVPVERRLAAQQHDYVYACGPAPMLERVGELGRAYGVPGELSREAYMRCGIGVCGSCTCGNGLLVCRDGPVFPAW